LKNSVAKDDMKHELPRGVWLGVSKGVDVETATRPFQGWPACREYKGRA
jgi:hypothetical protein